MLRRLQIGLLGVAMTGFVLITVGDARAATIFVDVNATGPTHDGTSWCTAYTALQTALAAAGSGDTVKVADGTYTPGTSVTSTFLFNVANSGVEVLGSFGGCGDPSPDDRATIDFDNLPTSILNGQLATDNTYHVVTSMFSTASTVLDGFKITNGDADGTSGSDYLGGGMLNLFSDITVRNCAFVDNCASIGGGMYSIQSDPTIENCVFDTNAAVIGAGMSNTSSSPAITKCRFINNDGSLFGGGMYNDLGSSLILTNCEFIGNEGAFSPMIPGGGGGLCNNNGSHVELINCLFTGNRADKGGGIGNRGGSDIVVTNCTFANNVSNYQGGGFYNNDSVPVITNCIFWDNISDFRTGVPNKTGEDGQIEEIGSGGIIIDYSCVKGWTGGFGGTGNIGDDPEFIDADGADDTVGTPDDNLRLMASSPSSDTGDNASLPADTADLDDDGNTTEQIPFDLDLTARIAFSVVDMGPYEVDAVCGDELCDASENSCSCEDDCGPPPSTELPASTCHDGEDNDCDGNADCADTDCQTGTETNCTDGIDNDCDGKTDCLDPNCFGHRSCQAGGGESE